MGKWLSASEIAKQTNIPESTTRRYLSNFEKFFRYQDRSRGKRYHPDAVVIVTRIQSLYAAGAESEEIEENLLKEFPITLNDHHGSTTEQPPLVPPYATSDDIAKIMDRLNVQEEFNKALLERLDQQQNYIEESLKRRDEQLVTALRELIDPKKELAASQEETKPWWKKIFGKK